MRRSRTNIPSARRAVSLVLVFVLVLGILAAVAYAQGGPLNAELFLLAAAAPIVLVAPVIAFRRDYDVFEPLSYVLLSVLIGVTARTFLLVMDRNADLASFLLLGNPMSILVPGMTVIIVGLAAFAAGYMARIPRVPLGRIRGLREDFHRPRLALIVVPSTLVSIGCVVLFMKATGGWTAALGGAISDIRTVPVAGSAHWAALGYYRWGAALAIYVYCCVLVTIVGKGAKRSMLWTAAAVGLGVLAVLLPFLASSRTNTLLIIVVTALIFHYGRGRLSARHVAVAVLLGLTGFAAMGALRNETRPAPFQSAPGFAGALEETIGTRHWLGVDKTSLIIQAVPRVLPYQWGGTLVTWVTAPIPRTLWPDKSLIRVGPIIGDRIYGLDPLTTGVPPGLVAELYWNFGLVGVVAGMFLFGAVLRAMYRSFSPLLIEGRPGAIVAYTVVVAPLALQLPGADVSGAVIAVLAAGIPTAILLRFVTGPGPKRGARLRPEPTR
ncbi:MAG TPA: O-antigen polymerase [Gemmatimonadaceae bacterium]